MKHTSISRIFHKSIHYPSLPTLSISCIRTESTSALTIQDKKKLLSQSKQSSKNEIERAVIIRSKTARRLNQQLEEEKPEHHHSFMRVIYKPDFPDSYPPTDVSKLDPTSIARPKPFSMQRTGVIAKKVGMTTLFDSKGVHHPVSILKMDAVQVIQINHTQNLKRGTFNQQLGYGHGFIRDMNWSMLGVYNAHNVSPKEKLMDFQCGHTALIKPGTEITCRHFLPGQFVDIKGISKDKGFQGVMKRWGFKGGPATHGSSKFHRRRGAMGGSADPGKVWKGKRMPGHMGNKNRTNKNMRVFRIEPKNNLIYVLGHVPGYMDEFVRIRDCHFNPPKSPPFPTFFPDPNEKELPEGMEWQGAKKNYLWNRDPNMDDWLDDKVTEDLK